MGLKFVPEYMFDKFNDVTPEFLSSIKVSGVILDIDNTLEPYETEAPEEHVISWLNALGELGIKCAFVSNNNRERVELFNKKLGYPAYYKAGKPFKKNVLLAMKDIGSTAESTILIGDQVFTDILAAHNAGIKGILVKPINDKRDILTRFKRLLEKPVIKRYKKRKKI